MPASRWSQEEDENKTGCRDVGAQKARRRSEMRNAGESKVEWIRERIGLFRRRSNGERLLKGLTWREKYKIVIVIVTNVTEKYSNIRPSEVDYIKQKKQNFDINIHNLSPEEEAPRIF